MPPHTHRYIFLLLLLTASLLRAEVVQGVCTRVIDGDTLTLELPDKQELAIRLYGIDAPEKSQEYGQAARDRLTELVLGKTIRADIRSTDRNNRSVARIYRENTDINLALVQEGYAWHYLRYAPQALELAEAETLACAEKIGLWQHAAPIPPWEYRRGARPARPNEHNYPYWITENGKVHNERCKYFGVTQRGHYTPTPTDNTSDCLLCGGASGTESASYPAWWNILLLALLFFLLPFILIRLLIVRAGQGKQQNSTD